MKCLKLIKNRELRMRILRMFRFVPDKMMLKLQYRIKTGNRLGLKKPKRFTEKLQWYKLNYRDELMIQCVDKYEVRKYIMDMGYEKNLLKCYGVFNSFEEIDFSLFPDSFVVKDTLGGGGNSVCVCHNRETENLEKLRLKMDKWIYTPLVRTGGREWPYYSGKKHRIIVEEYIDTDNPKGLIDYKFFCFYGKFEYMYLVCDRVLGQSAKLAIYDKELRKLDVYRCDEQPLIEEISLPDNINEMIEIAQNIASPFPHARVDLYNEEGRILFGEITFFDGSGYMSYSPDEFDFEVGEKFELP